MVIWFTGFSELRSKAWDVNVEGISYIKSCHDDFGLESGSKAQLER
jgi:hypothetical protein